jgi:glycosyltransferase involved in cell wall biosynthesis
MSEQSGTPATPLVSVVMPVFNGERFLAVAIDSILAQTYARFEFVIVDDGSSDRTPEILSEYQARDARIRTHRHEKNLGLTAALNQGVQMATGALVARMDADDVSIPERFARQVEFLREHPEVAVVGSWVQRIGEDGKALGLQRFPPEPALVAWSMLFCNSLAHPSVMMRREAIAGPGPYSFEYPNIEDYELFMRLSRTHRLANIPEPLLRYRTWGGNVTRDAKHLHHGMRVLRDALAAIGVTVQDDHAAAMLGLSRDNYPREIADIRALAELIKRLRALYIQRVARDAQDRAAIDGDAGVKLLLLAALAAQQSPALAASLSATALRIAPGAALTFAAKAGSRVGSVLRRTLRPA